MKKIYQALFQAKIQGVDNDVAKKKWLIQVLKWLIIVLVMLKAFYPQFDSVIDTLVVAIQELVINFSI